MIGSIFSHLTCWTRSQYYIVYDSMILFVEVVWSILCSISYNWMRQILKYLCGQVNEIHLAADMSVDGTHSSENLFHDREKFQNESIILDDVGLGGHYRGSASVESIDAILEE